MSEAQEQHCDESRLVSDETAFPTEDSCDAKTFDCQPAIEYIEGLVALIDGLPSFDLLMERNFSKDCLTPAIETLRLLSIGIASPGPIGHPLAAKKVRHDVNNPLSALMNLLDLIKESPPKGDQVSAFGNAYKLAKTRVSSILNANLDVWKGTLSFSSTPLERLIGETIGSVAYRHNYDLCAKKCPGKLNDYPGKVFLNIDKNLKAFVHADGLALAIENLVNNAIHVAGDTQIAIEISVVLTSYDCIKITVRDTGRGLDFGKIIESHVAIARQKEANNQPLSAYEARLLNGVSLRSWSVARLFDAGESHRNSSGLGLSIVKKIVDSHHGHVEIDNHPDGGAIVTILLPDLEERDPDLRMKLVSGARLMEVV